VPGDGTFESIEKRTYTRPMKFWRERDVKPNDVASAESYLRKIGITFYEGSTAWLSDSGRLTVMNTPTELTTCDFAHAGLHTNILGHDVGLIERIQLRLSSFFGP
jgi:hypothetical protein